jgi:hypothetical protein
LISGERDPVTPPSYAERVARGLTQSFEVVFPGGGHAETSLCKTMLIASFLTTGRVEARDRACVAGFSFPSFEWPGDR